MVGWVAALLGRRGGSGGLYWLLSGVCTSAIVWDFTLLLLPRFRSRPPLTVQQPSTNSFPSGTVIHVSNLPFDITWKELKDIFSGVGKIGASARGGGGGGAAR